MNSPYALSKTTQVLTPDEPKGRVDNSREPRRKEPEGDKQDPLTEDSNSVTEEPDADKNEYEHWGGGETAEGNGCRAACSDGTETVAAFGDAVSEVFDLINELAFPGVIDVAAQERLDRDLNRVSKTYDEDEDSVFNRSKSYDQGRKAREFLDFIGAARPKNQKILDTPLPPPDLLSPSVAFFDIQRKAKSTVAFKSNEIQDSRDDDENEQKGKPEKQSDRYSSIVDSDGSDDSDDWSDGENEGTAEDDFKTYIDNIVSNRDERKTTSTIRSKFGSVISNAHSKYAVKQAKEQPELLTIVESSYEDEDKDEDLAEVLSGILKKEEQKNDDEHEDTKKNGVVEEDDYSTSAASESSFSSFEERHNKSFVYESAVSYAVSGDSFYEESMYDEDESFSNHTGSSIENEDSLIDGDEKDEICIPGASESLEIEESSSEEKEDESVTRRNQSIGSVGSVEKCGNFGSTKSSVAETLPEEGGETEQREDVEETPGFGSSHDHIYPADSIFSFGTQDDATDRDTIFDFGDEEIPENLLIKTNIQDESIKGCETLLDEEDDEQEYFRESEEENDRVERDQGREEAEPETQGREKTSEQGHTEETEEHEHHNGIKSYFGTLRIDPSETREGVQDRLQNEQEQNIKNLQNEEMSRVSKPFLTVLYGESETLASKTVSEQGRQLPRRRYPAAPNESVSQTEETYFCGDPSKSSHSSESSSLSSQVDSNVQKARTEKTMNKVKLISQTIDHQVMKQRGLARVRKYNQQKGYAAKCSQNSE